MKSSVIQSNVYVNDQIVNTIQDLEPYTLYVNPYFVITEFSNADKVSKHYYMGTQRVASELAVQTTSYSPLVSHSGSSSSASSSTESFKTQTNTGSTLNQGLESTLPEESSNPWLNNLNEALANFGEDLLTLEETQKDLPTIESIYPDLSPTTSYKTTTTTRVIYWYHPDYIGNVDLVTDNSGEAYEFFLYNPWGESLYEWNSGTASFSSPYRFNGKELDQETGLAYYGARYYDNQLSIWLSVDPLAHERERLTPYNFVSNNPILRTDPTGALDGDYFDEDGNHLGNDGIDDGKIYKVEGSSKFNIDDFKEGGKYFENQTEFNENNGDGFYVTEVGFDSDLSTLARIGYAEFRGSNNTEQQVGMDITLNRVGSDRYPNTLSGVIEQPRQYSSLNEGDPNRAFYENPASTLTNPANRNAWVRSVSNSMSILNGTNRGISQGATLYYSPRSMVPRNSKPNWNFNILTEINVQGVRSSHLKLFREQ